MARGLYNTPINKLCATCGEAFLCEKTAQKRCTYCNTPDAAKERAQESSRRWVAANIEHKRIINRNWARHHYVEVRARRKAAGYKSYNPAYFQRRYARRINFRQMRLQEMYRTYGVEDFFAAVNGPLTRWDGKIHIKCAGQAQVFMCGRNHCRKSRWLRPAPNRNVSCKKCLKVWREMFGDEPIPIMASDDWLGEDERKSWGF